MKPYQVSLTASNPYSDRPLLRTNYHYTVGAIEVKGLSLPLHTRAAEIACARALADGLTNPKVYAVIKEYR